MAVYKPKLDMSADKLADVIDISEELKEAIDEFVKLQLSDDEMRVLIKSVVDDREGAKK